MKVVLFLQKVRNFLIFLFKFDNKPNICKSFEKQSGIKSLLGNWLPVKKCLFFDDTALKN